MLSLTLSIYLPNLIVIISPTKYTEKSKHDKNTENSEKMSFGRGITSEILVTLFIPAWIEERFLEPSAYL